MDTYPVLRQNMREQKVSQERLADILGLDRSTLNRKMGCKQDFLLWEIAAIGKALGIPRRKLVSAFLPNYHVKGTCKQ